MIRLPIDSSLDRIMEGLAHRCVVVVAPPGSGKTTRVPVALLNSGLLKPQHPTVVVLQPRRVAARASAARIAEEQGWSLGDQVGFQVRFERRFSSKTRLRFLTEGILTRQILADPFLETVGAVILDEFHERNLNSDLALALLQEVRREVRPDLILVVMSATLDADSVARFLDGCPIVRVEGRTHSISLEYRPLNRPASAETLVPMIQGLLAEPRDRGDILVFLPGMAEIRRIWQRLEPAVDATGALVLALHGSLPAEDQDRVFRPSDRRKVILSTNIAETSLTIDGVTTVIDSGLARIVRFDADRGIDRWELCRISRAAADQRAGRAGRTGPGRAIRLWSEREHRGLPEFEQPEIHRVDLCATLLALHAWGIADPGRFGWYDPPAMDRIAAAERLLRLLGGLAGDPPRITSIGEQMLDLPIHPRLARLLLAARQSGRVRDGAAIAALLSERDIKLRQAATDSSKPQTRLSTASSPSDVLDRLDLLDEAEGRRFAMSLRSHGIDVAGARQVALLRDELLRRERGPSSGRDLVSDRSDDEILKWLLVAYPDRVVKQRGAERTGLMVGGRGVWLAPESAVRDADLYLALEAREDRRAGSLVVQVSLASQIRLEWLEELFPQSLRRERLTRYDESRGRVVSANRLWYLDLLLREDVDSSLDLDQAGPVLAEILKPQAAGFFHDDSKAASWLARLDLVRRAIPELNWLDFDDELFAELLDQVCQGKSSLDQVKQTDLIPFLQSRLDRLQIRELHDGAPETITIPSGRVIRLVYQPGRPPILAARLQELFGWTETPRLARGRVPVLLHLLGPNNRPVQITDDLNNFWKTTYHQVRKDLRGRYPKHAWPEDPLGAEPPPRGKPK
jgi:ATP-dependent helicase HrpB